MASSLRLEPIPRLAPPQGGGQRFDPAAVHHSVHARVQVFRAGREVPRIVRASTHVFLASEAERSAWKVGVMRRAPSLGTRSRFRRLLAKEGMRTPVMPQHVCAHPSDLLHLLEPDPASLCDVSHEPDDPSCRLVDVVSCLGALDAGDIQDTPRSVHAEPCR